MDAFVFAVRSHLDSAPKQTPVSTTQIPSVVANGYGQSITNSSRLMPKETNLLSGNLRYKLCWISGRIASDIKSNNVLGCE